MPHKVNYCKAIVIVHGKSELMLAEYIKSNLRLNIEIVSRDRGKSSIQVNGLMKFLNSDSRFKSIKAIEKNFLPKVKNGKLENCYIIPIMDLDDCSEAEGERYKSGEMFNSSYLKEYIIPIWNCPNFDVVMKKAGVIEELPDDRDKVKTYTKVFPKSHSNKTNEEEIREFSNSMKKANNTNLEKFVDMCLKMLKNNDF